MRTPYYYREIWISKKNRNFSLPKGHHGVREGCRGSCDSQPCQNNGLCIEHYSDYTCNCSATAFKGRTCIEDVSVHFDGSQSIRANLSSVVQDRLKVHLAFAYEGQNPDETYIFQTNSLQNRSLLGMD